MQVGCKKALRYLCNTRIEEIRHRVSLKNRKFLKINQEIERLQLEIRQQLPEDSQNLLMEYESAEVSQGLLLQEILYKKAFIDGIQFANVCRKVLEI